MRISSVGLLLALAACSQGSQPLPGAAIECAIDGATSFSRTCTAERVDDAIVVRRPDGGFRRVIRTADGPATDGADAATQDSDGTLTIGRDRYRLPQ